MQNSNKGQNDRIVYVLGISSFVSLGAFVAIPLMIDGRPWWQAIIAWAFTFLLVTVSAYAAITTVAVVSLPLHDERTKLGILLTVMGTMILIALRTSLAVFG